jgi:hypothetical protein
MTIIRRDPAPTLYLHIGSPKTGSSYIQTSLRLSREKLAEKGLIYPSGTEMSRLDERSWTAGNGIFLFSPKSKVDRYIETSLGRSARGIVFSSESMLIGLSDPATRKRMAEILRRFDIKNVRILVYLREPIAYGVSYWLQMVKRHGYTSDLDTFLTETSFIQDKMKMTSEVLDFLSIQNGFEITALNYSYCKKDLLATVSKWLELERETLVIPKAEKVNRSLDAGETFLQLELNRILGPYACFLAKSLTEGITESSTGNPAPSIQLQESIWAETEPWIERLNHYLPTGQGLAFDRMEPKEDARVFSFTDEQLKLIAESLGGEIRKSWDSETRLMAFYRRVSDRIRKTFHSRG